MLHSAVGVQEFPAQVSNLVTLPGHDHPGLFRDHSHPVCLQILLFRGGDKGVRVLGGNDDRHTLLGFGDGQLRAVQTVVLFPHGIQIDAQAVSQLTDGHGHAARAKVIAALDQPGDLAIPEQALNFPLLGGIALLDLGSHGGQGLHIVALGGTGGAADAVPARAAAQQDHHIPGCGALPADIARGSGCHNSAALQTLGDKALVVQLRHMAGSQTDLVAVGGVTRGGGLTELPLGQLAGQGVLQRGPGVSRAGDPHGLMHIGTAGQGIPDAAADTGGRAAEGLNFCGMVVGLVLEHQQPVLVLPVDGGRHMDGAGVDFLALVQLRELALLFQVLGADGGNVHQSLGPGSSLLLTVDRHTGSQIFLIGSLNSGVMDDDVVQMCGKGGVAAVVGPISVHHPNFRNGGVPLLLVPEVCLKEFQIIQVHGKAQFFQQC